ncbi:MAG: glycosyltransferase family 4 protein [Chlamydiota bacterium]|nr:glycosyltransferase family 4 protein [Chlamydiota bacterium]
MSNLKYQICIFTTVHSPFDTRVFHKEAISLVKSGYDVILIAPHTKDEIVDGIFIKAIHKPKSRLKRMTQGVWDVYQKAIHAQADIYHFHDPELIPIGLILRIKGKKVIYDVHEYYKEKIKSKTYIPKLFRHLLAFSFDVFETFVSRFFTAIIVTDTVTAKKFRTPTLCISNYPSILETPFEERKKNDIFSVIYVGILSRNRGLFKMVEAIELIQYPSQLLLIGDIKSKEDENIIEHLKNHDRAHLLGPKPWPEAMAITASCHAGLAVFQPVPAYLYAGMNTVKLFEYMMLALPVIASDFQNLSAIINRIHCGITVNPSDPKLIAQALEYLILNPIEAAEMGRRGRLAVEKEFNWSTEENKLLDLYHQHLR